MLPRSFCMKYGDEAKVVTANDIDELWKKGKSKKQFHWDHKKHSLKKIPNF